MWRKIALFVASIPLFGSAMTSADAAPARQCRVLAAEKLAPGSGSAAAICAEVERAMDAAIPGARYQIDVRVISPARLSATGSVDGRKFPEQNLASSDRNLTPGAIRRFARALGEAVKAAR
jgi:uncharacterized membrane protein